MKRTAAGVTKKTNEQSLYSLKNIHYNQFIEVAQQFSFGYCACFMLYVYVYLSRSFSSTVVDATTIDEIGFQLKFQWRIAITYIVLLLYACTTRRLLSSSSSSFAITVLLLNFNLYVLYHVEERACVCVCAFFSMGFQVCLFL